MEGRGLLESRSLWARRKLSFDLRKESGLDFKKAFKTIIQHFGVPKWMVETTRKPQVVYGQKESGGRCAEVSKGRQKSAGASGRAHSAQELQSLKSWGTRERRRATTEGRLRREEMALKDSCMQRLGRMPISCQGNAIILCAQGFRGVADF
jgi:hypothetical protein